MRGDGIAYRLRQVGLIVPGTLLAYVAITSLGWRFQHDSSILLYITFLFDRFGSIPYRDVFDMNMPGTYLAYYLIGKLSGYTDFGVRCADLLILAATMGLTWKWMRRIGRGVAWSGAILWGSVYLASGPLTSLQREYLLLVPVIAGVCVHSLLDRQRGELRFAATGLCFGVAAAVKPQAAIGLPVVLLFELGDFRGNAGRSLRGDYVRGVLLPAALGFCLPPLCGVIYLWSCGGLSDFLDLAAHYWPLYGQLSGWHETISGLRRVSYLAESYRSLGGAAFWIAPAAVGGYVSLYVAPLKEEERRRVRLLLGLTVCYSVYPVFSGQFWPYHWLPLLYFLVQAASLCQVDLPREAPRGTRLFPALVLLCVIFSAIPDQVLFDSLAKRTTVPNGGRVDEIADFLRRNLQPGDTVQPLDWTGGVVHAMLLSNARISTPFIYDFHFYHHISNDYIQRLRRRFLVAVTKARPRFFISVFSADKPWVWGADTTTQFPELQSLLSSRYRVVGGGAGYVIHQRNEE